MEAGFSAYVFAQFGEYAGESEYGGTKYTCVYGRGEKRYAASGNRGNSVVYEDYAGITDMAWKRYNKRKNGRKCGVDERGIQSGCGRGVEEQSEVARTVQSAPNNYGYKQF